MKKRTLLATATLTALVLSFGALQPAPVEGPAELASHAQPLDAPAPAATEAPASPQWGYIWGLDREEAAVFGLASVFTCAPFIMIGAIACGVTAVA